MVLIQYLQPAFWVVACILQGFTIMCLIHVVTDLEKLTQRKNLPNNWSFQKKKMFSLAIFSTVAVTIMVGGREVMYQDQTRQMRDMSENSFRIEVLEKEIKELKASPPKQ